MTTGSPTGSTGNNTPLIEAKGLHTFYGDSHILHGIDITIQRSETVSNVVFPIRFRPIRLTVSLL